MELRPRGRRGTRVANNGGTRRKLSGWREKHMQRLGGGEGLGLGWELKTTSVPAASGAGWRGTGHSERQFGYISQGLRAQAWGVNHIFSAAH